MNRLNAGVMGVCLGTALVAIAMFFALNCGGDYGCLGGYHGDRGCGGGSPPPNCPTYGDCFPGGVCPPTSFRVAPCTGTNAACVYDDGTGYPLGVSGCHPMPGFTCAGDVCLP